MTWVTFNKNFKENTYLLELKWLIFYPYVYSVVKDGEIPIRKEAEYKTVLATFDVNRRINIDQQVDGQLRITHIHSGL